MDSGPRRYEEQRVTSCCPGLGRTEEDPAPVLLGAGQGSDGVARDEVYLSPVRVPGLRWRSEVDVFWPRAPHWWRPDVVVGLGVMEVLRSRDSKVVSQWAVEERLRSERKLREEGDAKLGGYEGGGCAARMRLDKLLTHMRLGPAEDVSEVQDLG
ncbi:unnamed protein product [Arctogadus glacialis]